MDSLNAASFVSVLARGTGADKRTAIDWLDACGDSEERARVRALLSHHLETTHAPPRKGDEEEVLRRDARAWMLSALGRVSDADPAADDLIRKHLDPEYEPSHWARYWALEGVAVGRRGAHDSFTHVAQTDPDPLVSYAALAIIAVEEGGKAVADFREKFLADQWPGLRALRIAMVPDRAVFEEVIRLVREGRYEDTTYDAIVALAQVSPGTPEADEAAEALSGYVRRYRWPMYDSMRTNALVSLGQLRSKLSVPVLMEELTDQNPMIVLQAARALEATLGTGAACRRILEAAAAGPRPPQAFAGALRALTREPAIDVLESGLTGSSSIGSDTALVLLRELGGAEALDRLRALRQTTKDFLEAQSKADADLRTSLDESLGAARAGFRIVTAMDIAVFVAGFAMLALGMVLVWRAEDSLGQLTGALTAGTGFAGVILRNWLSSARDRIEPSVRRLLALQAAFHGYLRELRQVDQAYTQRVLSGSLSPTEVREFTGIVDDATERAHGYLTGTGVTNEEEVTT